VAADVSIGNDRLWFDKYRMRSEMIPSFIKFEQAEKILLVGKSINFLRLVCRDRTDIPINDKATTFTNKSDDAGMSFRYNFYFNCCLFYSRIRIVL